MKDFAHLVLQLDQTNKTHEKVAHLTAYFAQATDPDKLWAIALFSGKRPRQTVKTSQLREWAAEAAGIPLWLLEESYHVAGDLAETLSLLVPGQVQNGTNPTLHEHMEFLIRLRQTDDEEKRTLVTDAWRRMSQQEKFVFNKLITGGFRLGVSQKLMVKALARHTGLDENLVSHRLMGGWEPGQAVFRELLFDEAENDDLSRPYPFYLAYALDQEPEELGNPDEWQAEWKWDGIRSQLIWRGGQWFIWSRGEELITDKFPELQAMAAHLPDGTVIDGELMPYKNGEPLPFQELQTRIGRKNVTKKILESCPVVIMGYDVLEWGGKDLRAESLAHRREILQQAVQQVQLPQLMISPVVEFQSWEELAAQRLRAREVQAEGLMLKRLAAPYQVGRKKGDWWKWKVEPLSVDAVMIYAQRGHGRRANLYTDYTFAVWEEGQLVPFTKAYSGLTDAEIREVDAWVKRNTIERFGPVRSVKPELVFEIGFEGINRSSRHKSGVALRFPRMLRWRTDKPASEADHLDSLRKLLPS